MFADTYGSGTYNSSTYNGASTSTTTTVSDPAASGGLLTNTGFDVLLVISVACLIIFAALVIRFWKRPARVAEAVSVDDDNSGGQ